MQGGTDGQENELHHCLRHEQGDRQTEKGLLTTLKCVKVSVIDYCALMFMGFHSEIEVQYRCGRKLEQFIYACVRKT